MNNNFGIDKLYFKNEEDEWEEFGDVKEVEIVPERIDDFLKPEVYDFSLDFDEVLSSALFLDTSGPLIVETSEGVKMVAELKNNIRNIHRIKKGKRYVIKFDYGDSMVIAEKLRGDKE